MHRDILLETIEESDLCDYADQLVERASLLLYMKPGSSAVGIRSRFCGSPNLPPDFKWPECDLGYRFALQLDFSEMPKCCDGQPDNGLLSLFLETNHDNGNDWSAPGCIKAFYFEGDQELPEIKSPAEAQSFAPVPISYISAWDLPFNDLDQESFFITNAYEEYNDLKYSLEDNCREAAGLTAGQSNGHCFGYPLAPSLPHDPSPGPEWIQLMSISTNEELELFFYDHAHFMVFIEKDRLANKDFSNLVTCAG